jgi:hypothetical protein
MGQTEGSFEKIYVKIFIHTIFMHTVGTMSKTAQLLAANEDIIRQQSEDSKACHTLVTNIGASCGPLLSRPRLLSWLDTRLARRLPHLCWETQGFIPQPRRLRVECQHRPSSASKFHSMLRRHLVSQGFQRRGGQPLSETPRNCEVDGSQPLWSWFKRVDRRSRFWCRDSWCCRC